MIIGIGIDHVQSQRIKNVLVKWPGRFEKRVFDDAELEYAKSRREPHLHLAARFAAKEAKDTVRGSTGRTWLSGTDRGENRTLS